MFIPICLKIYAMCINVLFNSGANELEIEYLPNHGNRRSQLGESLNQPWEIFNKRGIWKGSMDSCH